MKGKETTETDQIVRDSGFCVFTYSPGVSRRLVLFLIALQPGFVNGSAIGHHAPDDNTLIK